MFLVHFMTLILSYFCVYVCFVSSNERGVQAFLLIHKRVEKSSSSRSVDKSCMCMISCVTLISHLKFTFLTFSSYQSNSIT